MEAAWAGSLAAPRAGSLAAPRAGHIPFVAVLQPGLPVKPLTLFVNKAPVAGDRHGALTWGAAQAGVASGVALAVREGVVPAAEADGLPLIAAVWVDPAAADEEAVFRNNQDATLGAIRTAVAGEPQVAAVVAAADDPRNPYFRSGRA